MQDHLNYCMSFLGTLMNQFHRFFLLRFGMTFSKEKGITRDSQTPILALRDALEPCQEFLTSVKAVVFCEKSKSELCDEAASS